MSDKIFGRTFEEIQDMQQNRHKPRTVDMRIAGDYGADPVGDGTFRMVPSGDIVDYAERCRRLAR